MFTKGDHLLIHIHLIALTECIFFYFVQQIYNINRILQFVLHNNTCQFIIWPNCCAGSAGLTCS